MDEAKIKDFSLFDSICITPGKGKTIKIGKMISGCQGLWVGKVDYEDRQEFWEVMNCSKSWWWY
jgi:hypothetical protein